MSLERIMLVLAIAGAAGVAGCSPAKDGGEDETPTPTPTVFASADGSVKFKRAERLRNDFATALGIAPNELCNELGNFSCTDLVHLVALGSVEPYAQGIYEPPRLTGASTPTIVDRVALSGCIVRVDCDFRGANPGGLFHELDLHGARLESDDASEAKARAAIDQLYRRATARSAELFESDRLFALYAEVEAQGSTRPARDWAVLSCFIVMSSTESVFY